MRLLVLGGTKFVGKHLVEAALSRGHEVTLFNRGQTNTTLFPDTERRTGDRDGALDSLATGTWDAVLDVNGYLPRLVRDSAELLAGRVDHYVFVSTVSVYGNPMTAGLDEAAPLAELDDPDTEEITGETYGGLKARCERAVQDVYPEQFLIVRPGLVAGPDDPTGRFTYWPERLAEGGVVLAPSPRQRVQFIDVRDLAAFALDLAERREHGVFNATGPVEALTFGEFLQRADAAAGGPPSEFIWASDEFLIEQGVAPFMGLPMWMPESGPTGMLAVALERSVKAGLSTRPLEETVRDTLTWVRRAREDGAYVTPPEAGITREQEQEILAAR